MELFAPLHLLVIFLIFVLLFGPGKVPEIGRSLGEAIREFKNASKEITSDNAAKPKEVMLESSSRPE